MVQCAYFQSQASAMTNPFHALYSDAQMTAFRKIQAALVADPTALDNRGGDTASVAALTDQTEVSSGQA